MNFNFTLFIILFLVSACGVKGDPRAPDGTELPSFLENYDDIETPAFKKRSQKK